MREHSLPGTPIPPSPNPAGIPGPNLGARRIEQRPLASSAPRSEASGFGAGIDGPPSAAPRQAAGGSATSSSDSSRTRRRRRGSRGGRRRGSSSKPSDDKSEEKREEAPSQPKREESSSDSGEGGSSRSRSRRSRRSGSRKRSKTSANKTQDEEKTEAAQAKPKKRSSRRGKRGGRRKQPTAVEIEAIPGEEDELPELVELPEEAVLISDEEGPAKNGRAKRTSRKKKSSKASKKTSKRSGSRRSRADDEDEPAQETPPKHRIILVNAADPEETRVAVVEDGKIVDLQMTVKKQVSFVSDIYRGRVVNLEPAIGAAFVDFGQGRNGFLHASDLMPCYAEDDWSLDKLLQTPVESEAFDSDADPDADPENEDEPEKEAKPEPRKTRSVRRNRKSRKILPIEKLVKKGQMVAVQITKDAIGDKGPTLTTYVSIPGRYLVLMPSLQRTGVSRKIEDEKERRRLKRILSALKIPEGMGVIVRTAGVGKTKAEIKRDLDYLLLAWEEFSRRLKSGRNPAPLYQESDVAIRTMRDLFTSETEAVLVDDPGEYDRMVEFTKRLMPEHLDRVKMHKGSRPLLHSQGVEQDFEKIFSRRVELPSGGSIVIDQTEALVAIDVNSGRTREEGADFEDIALKTNLEAAPEIARQIRLRDLGGIIVLDYIDMMKTANRRQVEKATRDAVRRDRARSKLGRISQFGLLELTRQRLGPGLSKLVYDSCRRCRGSGRQRTSSSRAQAILRRLGTALSLKGFTEVEVRAHPEVIEYLQKNLSGELQALEESSGRKLTLLSVPDQVEDSVLHYLRADGREVRPGGRRKR